MFVIRSAVALSSSICHDESVRCCECILILPPIVEIQVLDWSRWFLNTNYVGCCDITLLTPCNWGFTRLNRTRVLATGDILVNRNKKQIFEFLLKYFHIQLYKVSIHFASSSVFRVCLCKWLQCNLVSLIVTNLTLKLISAAEADQLSVNQRRLSSSTHQHLVSKDGNKKGFLNIFDMKFKDSFKR